MEKSSNMTTATNILTQTIHSLGGCDNLAEIARQGYDMSSFISMTKDEMIGIFSSDFSEELDRWIEDYHSGKTSEEYPNPLWYKAAKKSGKLDD
jgi:hypothetical protein